jgi:transposase-like protein
MLRFVKVTPRAQPSSASRDVPPPAGLPDPREQATPEAAAEYQAANEEILQLTPEERSQSKKRGPYKRFDEEKRLKIAEDAVMNGSTWAANKWGINESTVRSIRDQRNLRMKEKRNDGNLEPLDSLPTNPRGRPKLLPEEVDNSVQRHLKAIRSSGGVVNRSIAMATGRGILRASQAKTDVTPGRLGVPWAVSMLRRLGYVQRKGTKAARKVPPNLQECRAEFLERIKTVVTSESIPREHAFSFYQ